MDSIYLMLYLGITTFILFQSLQVNSFKIPPYNSSNSAYRRKPNLSLDNQDTLPSHTFTLFQNLPMQAYSHALFQLNIHWPHPSVSYAFLLHTFAHTILKYLLFLPWLSKCFYPSRSKLIPTFSKKVFQTLVMVITFVVKLILFLLYSLMTYSNILRIISFCQLFF